MWWRICDCPFIYSMLLTVRTVPGPYTTSRACCDIMTRSNTTAGFLLFYPCSIEVPIDSAWGTAGAKGHDRSLAFLLLCAFSSGTLRPVCFDRLLRAYLASRFSKADRSKRSGWEKDNITQQNTLRTTLAKDLSKRKEHLNRNMHSAQ